MAEEISDAPGGAGAPSPGMAAALDALAEVEPVALGGPPAPVREFSVAGRLAWSSDLDRLRAMGELPDPVLARAERPRARTSVASAAAAARLGKRPSPTYVRVRALFHGPDRPLSLKIWRTGPSERARRQEDGQREREARRRLGAHGYPAPPLLGEGAVDGTEFLVEPVVFGTTPDSGPDRRRAVLDLVPRLVSAYESSGVRDRRLSRMVRPRLVDKIGPALREPGLEWPGSAGDRDDLIAALERLVDADRRLPCALGHGDLSMPNVIRDPRRTHWLVDWEGAIEMPVAFDLRRLLFASRAPRDLLGALGGLLDRFDGDGRRRYRWCEQLALGVANELAAIPRQRAGAAEHGRLAAFDARTRARIAWVAELVGT